MVREAKLSTQSEKMRVDLAKTFVGVAQEKIKSYDTALRSMTAHKEDFERQWKVNGAQWAMSVFLTYQQLERNMMKMKEKAEEEEKEKIEEWEEALEQEQETNLNVADVEKRAEDIVKKFNDIEECK